MQMNKNGHRPAGRSIAATVVALSCANAANAQLFDNETNLVFDCFDGNCPVYKLDPAMACIYAGLCLPNNDNFCDQPIHMVAGGAAGDFNNDGFQDIFLPQGGNVPDMLWINDGQGAFVDEAAAWGVDALHIGSGVAVGDYDNDGWLDIFMSGFGPATGPVQGGRHLLYRNTGNGTFEEVAEQAGVAMTSPDCTDAFGAAFGDYDLDGDLDLCVAGWVDVDGGTRLFKNNGDGTFTDASDVVPHLTDAPGATKVRGFAPRFVDMNKDRWPELLLTCDFGDGDPLSARYYLNNKDGTFSDVTDDPGSGLGLDQNAMGQAVADFNADGFLDWFITNIYDPQGAQHGWPSARTGNKLYMNNGDNTFDEIAEDVGIDDGGWGWGTVAVDVDNDGDVDIVETNGFKGFGGQFTGIPLYLYENNGDATFNVITGDVSGLAHPGHGRGLIALDYDNDGDIDIVNISWNSQVRLYQNDSITDPESVPADKAYLRIKVDTSDDPGVIAPNGYGTQFAALADNGVLLRTHISGGDNYLSQSELVAHYGLGDATIVTDLVIHWPNGMTAHRENVPINQTLNIRFCRGDWNADGAQNILDFVAYTSDWQNKLPAADMDENGQYNVLDFVAWQVVYNKCIAGL
jgi:hypothetical protein